MLSQSMGMSLNVGPSWPALLAVLLCLFLPEQENESSFQNLLSLKVGLSSVALMCEAFHITGHLSSKWDIFLSQKRF